MIFLNQGKNLMRQGGIEPPSIAWKATMLTITPLTQMNIFLSNLETMKGKRDISRSAN